MKKNVLILIILAALAVVLILVVVIGNQPGGGEKLPNISTIEVSTQNTGGVTSTNYMPLLEESVDWAALSDDERADIARAAVSAVIERAAQEGVTKFNVIGITRPQNEPVFFYTGEGSVYIYVNGEAAAISLNA